LCGFRASLRRKTARAQPGTGSLSWLLTVMLMQPGLRNAAAGTRSRRALVIVLAVVYATCFVAIKIGLAFAPPLLFAGLRALIAGLALLGFLIILRHPVFPARQSWPWVFGLALVSTTLALAAMFLSPSRSGAGIASVLGNLQPVVVLALAAPVLGEPITGGKAGSLALGFVGALMVSSTGLMGPGGSDVLGPILALVASLSVATGNVLAKRMGSQPRLLAIASWQLLLGSIPLLTASAVLEEAATTRWEPTFVITLLFLALAGTALPTPIWYWLVRDDDLGQLTLFLFLVPAFGLGLGVGVLGEPVSAAEILGTGVILAGIVVATRTRAAPEAPPTAAETISAPVPGTGWLGLPCGCACLCAGEASE
jgi:drug/metabolite transporter (DMT)-like permease